ncbi:MAG: hypothetical protein JETT_0370 [Candidatus Jettenia ecosi]|uniref:Uncharacterized protein n=1 Tax=Candidatus Jettenia ecosi TaxID=2494326 RepID=A0A533QF23_9BACT|nr:MAG: hypothetical protein JETT_0370 [Candidatus Jettenia ecosi]
MPMLIIFRNDKIFYWYAWANVVALCKGIVPRIDCTSIFKPFLKG